MKKTPRLTPQQKSQILGDDVAAFTEHLAVAAAKGGHTLPLTSFSRRTDVLLGYLERAARQKPPAKGSPVLTFVI
jgi:hypothetical protein